MSDRKASPFDTIRTRSLVLQIALVVPATLLFLNSFVPAYKTKDYEGATMALVYIVILLVVMIRGWRAKLDWGRLLGPRPALKDLPLLAVIVPLALLTAGALTLVYVPLSYVAPELVEQVILKDSTAFQVETVAQLAILAFTVVVVAPVVEELVFRGFMMHRMERKWGTAPAMIASSLIFAVAHVEWVGHFLIGMAFALIYQRTRSLWMGMLTHGVYNGIFIIPFAWQVLQHKPETTETLAEFRDGLEVGVLTFMCGVMLLWMYLDLYWKEHPVTGELQLAPPYERYAEDAAVELPSVISPS